MLTKQFETLTEADIIQRIKEGEIGLFEILIRRNNPFLYKIGMSYVYNHQDVEDLMQETFIAAYLNLDKFENRSSFRTWITRIMLNQCYHKAQKLSYKNEKLMDTNSNTNDNSIPLFQDESSAEVYKKVANKEISEAIGQALISLPIDYRIVFCLRELNGMNTADTASALNITETNVKVRLNRSKQMLRDAIIKMYSTKDVFEFNLVYCDAIVERVMKKIQNL